MVLIILSFVFSLILCDIIDVKGRNWFETCIERDSDDTIALPVLGEKYGENVTPGASLSSLGLTLFGKFYVFGGEFLNLTSSNYTSIDYYENITYTHEHSRLEKVGYSNCIFEYSWTEKMFRLLKGTKYLRQLNDIVDTMNVYNDKNQPGGRKGSIGFSHETDQSLIIIGGYYEEPYLVNTTNKTIHTYKLKNLNDVWEFSTGKNQWRLIKNYTYDSSKNIMGVEITSQETVGDLGEEKNKVDQPGFRSYSSVASAIHYGIIFGGHKDTMCDQVVLPEFTCLNFGISDRLKNDVWKYNIQSNYFSKLYSNYPYVQNYKKLGVYDESNNPYGRSHASIWLINDEEFYIFGGTGKEAFLNDLWSFNMSSESLMWRCLSPLYHMTNGSLPVGYSTSTPRFSNDIIPNSRRSSGCFLTIENEDKEDEDTYLFTFGGIGYIVNSGKKIGESFGALDDYFTYSLKNGNWRYSKMGKSDETIPNIHYSISIKDENQRFIFFGEPGNSTFLDTVYSTDVFQNRCNRNAYYDDSTEECYCEEGYFPPYKNPTADDPLACQNWNCNNISRYDNSVCSGIDKGSCVAMDTCICDEYEGPWCETHSCFGEKKNETNVCNGHGDCGTPDNCSCTKNFYGEECAEKIEKCSYVIKNVTINDETTKFYTFTFTWDVDVDLILEYMYELDCSEVISNYTILGDGALCNFIKERDKKNVKSLVIKTSNTSLLVEESINGIFYFGVYPKTASEGTVARIKCKEETDDIPYAIIIILVSFSLVFMLVVLVLAFAILLVTLRLSKQLKKKKEQIQEYFKMESMNNPMLEHFNVKKELFEIPFEELNIGERIGKGGGKATVFKANWKGQEVAFKCFHAGDLSSEQDLKDFEGEVSLLSSLKHPRIVQFFGVVLRQSKIGIVVEYCANGTLRDYVEYYGNRFSFDEKVRIIYDVSDALEYLHERDIIHRDLKMDNLLLDSSLNVKLIDFGVSRHFEEKGNMTMKVGTSVYMAPEITLGGTLRYTHKVDVYSLSIVMYELMVEGKASDYFGEENTQNLEYRVALDPNFRPDLNALDSVLKEDEKWVRELIPICWTAKVDDRPTSKKLRKTIEKYLKDKSLKRHKSKDDLDDDVLFLEKENKRISQQLESVFDTEEEGEKKRKQKETEEKKKEVEERKEIEINIDEGDEESNFTGTTENTEESSSKLYEKESIQKKTIEM